MNRAKALFILLCLLALPLAAIAAKSPASPPHIEAQVKRAEQLYQNQRYEEAIEAFQRVLSAEPHNSQARMGLGFAYRRLNQLEEAIRAWQPVLGTKGAGRKLYNALGEASEALALADRSNEEEQIKRLEAAARYYRWSLGQRYNQPNVIAAVSRIEARLSRLQNKPALAEQALTRLRKAKKRYPENSKISLALADLMLDVRSADADEIHKVFNTSRLPKGDRRVRELISRINIEAGRRLFDSGHYESALSEYRKALNLAETDTAFKGLGWSYWKMGEVEKAIPIWEKLVAKNPNNPSLLNQLALIYSEAGKFEHSLSLYDRSLAIKPSQLKARAGRARVLEWTARYDTAIREYRKLIEQDPANKKEYEQRIAQSLFYKRDFTAAAAAWEKILKESGEVKAKVAYARALYHGGNYTKALPILYQVRASHPKNVAALETLLLYTQATNNENEMFKILQQLIKLKPDDTKHLNLWGFESLRRGLYDRTIEAFSRSLEIELFQTEPLIALADAYLLKGDLDNAEWRYQDLLQRNPNMAPRLRQGLADIYTLRGKPDQAANQMRKILKIYPQDLSIRLQLARLEADRGKYRRALGMLDKILNLKNKTAVPALLYHRVTPLVGEGAVTLKNFTDQLTALKKAGYQSITTQQLSSFYAGIGKLPKKPILITFDDAIRDAYLYGDEVLQKTGFVATMFIPVGSIGQNGSFFLNWDELQQMQESGRWNLQCHSYRGHEEVTANALGAQGRFLVNRRWLPEQRRMETEAEFVARVEQDYPLCRAMLQKKIPGMKLVAYSFPFGDIGTESLLNSKSDVIDTNLSAVRANFRVAFVQRKPGYNLRNTTPWLSMRMNVPPEWSGQDLLAHLKNENPFIKARFLKAQLLAEAGNYDQAMRLADSSLRSLDNRGPLHEIMSVAYQGQDNPVEAVKEWKQAMEKTENPSSEQTLAHERRMKTLKAGLRPRATFGFLARNDSRSRTDLKPTLDGRFHIFDHLFARLHYAHGFYNEDVAFLTPAQRDVNGDTIVGGLEYYWDRRTYVRVDGGYRLFDQGVNGGVVKGDARFPLVPRYLYFRAGSEYEPIEHASAIIAGLKRLDVSGGLEATIGRYGSGRVRYEESFVDDDNRIHQFGLNARAHLFQDPLVTVGYRFDWGNSNFDPREYYAPLNAITHAAEFAIRHNVLPRLRYSLMYSPGGGGDDLVGLVFIQAVEGSLDYRFSRNWQATVGGGYSRSPSYNAFVTTLAVNLQF